MTYNFDPDRWYENEVTFFEWAVGWGRTTVTLNNNWERG
jgi:hypothetical protein